MREFHNFSSSSNQSEKLLIVILSDQQSDKYSLPLIAMENFKLRHAKMQIMDPRYASASAVVLTHEGILLDVVDSHIETSVELKELFLTLTRGNKPLEKFPDSKNVFHKVLVIGKMEVLTLEAANALLALNLKYMVIGGLIRFQICRFSSKTIIGTDIPFYKAVSPSHAVCSIPTESSLISDRSTNALDIFFETLEDFLAVASKIRTALCSKTHTPQTLYKTVKKFIDEKINGRVGEIILVYIDGTTVNLTKMFSGQKIETIVDEPKKNELPTHSEFIADDRQTASADQLRTIGFYAAAQNTLAHPPTLETAPVKRL